MTKKLYTFNVQVQITLDDQTEFGEDWKLPEEISKEAKSYILYNLNEIDENSGNYFENGLYDVLNCPIDNVNFVLE